MIALIALIASHRARALVAINVARVVDISIPRNGLFSLRCHSALCHSPTIAAPCSFLEFKRESLSELVAARNCHGATHTRFAFVARTSNRIIER